MTNKDIPLETTVPIPPLADGEPDLTIAVAKAGGGTPGRRYAGLWTAVVTTAGREVYRTNDLNTPTASTHQDAARTVAVILGATGALGPELIGLTERLAAWADQH